MNFTFDESIRDRKKLVTDDNNILPKTYIISRIKMNSVSVKLLKRLTS